MKPEQRPEARPAPPMFTGAQPTIIPCQGCRRAGRRANLVDVGHDARACMICDGPG